LIIILAQMINNHRLSAMAINETLDLMPYNTIPLIIPAVQYMLINYLYL